MKKSGYWVGFIISVYAPNGASMINIPPSSLATFTPSTNKEGGSILLGFYSV
jgi:hypothetical protein